MPKIDAWMTSKKAAGKNNNCTLENAAVRREWFASRLNPAIYVRADVWIDIVFVGATLPPRRERNMSLPCSVS